MKREIEETDITKGVYEDDFIKITKVYLQIDRYYFPLATSKLVMLDEIQSISILDAKDVHTPWGMSRSELNHWFHLDKNRKNKPFFMSIKLKGKKTRIGITPQNIYQAFNTLVFLLRPNQNNQKKENQGEESIYQTVENIHEATENQLKLNLKSEQIEQIPKEVVVSEQKEQELKEIDCQK